MRPAAGAPTRLRLGTRASRLALLQAETVAASLPIAVELVHVTTAGDRDRVRGDKSRWIEALEHAVLGGRIDAAVHSVKDMPTELADGTELAAVTQRADPADALVGAGSLDALPERSTVGTSSLRRRSQLLARRPDVIVVEQRGNVDTRLQQLDARCADALVLAEAGLERLGVSRVRVALDPDVFVPAAGQGALGVQTRANGAAADILRGLDEGPVRRCVDAERSVVRALGADCDTSVGVHARTDDGQAMTVRAYAGLPNGSEWLLEAAAEPDALVTRLRAAGVEALLAYSAEMLRRQGA